MAWLRCCRVLRCSRVSQIDLEHLDKNSWFEYLPLAEVEGDDDLDPVEVVVLQKVDIMPRIDIVFMPSESVVDLEHDKSHP